MKTQYALKHFVVLALSASLVTAASVVADAQTEAIPMLPANTSASSPSPSPTPLSQTPSGLATQTSPGSATSTNGQPIKATPAPVASSVISITKVVGEVGDQYVTSREVKINAAVEQAMQGKPATPEGGYKIPQTQERGFSGDVSRVLDEWAVYFEARSLGSSSASKSDVARAVSQVQELWATSAEWKEIEVGTEELRVMVERKLAASEFQKLKSDPALSPVSDDEALSYYKKNRLRFGSLPFSSFSENIKAYLVKTQVERRLSEWHEVLRRKYKTRNFISG